MDGERELTQNIVELGQLKNDIKKLLVNVSGLPGLSTESIEDDASLFEGGLGLDSIDILEFVVRLDKDYGLKILNDDNGRAILQNVETIALAIHANQT